MLNDTVRLKDGAVHFRNLGDYGINDSKSLSLKKPEEVPTVHNIV